MDNALPDPHRPLPAPYDSPGRCPCEYESQHLEAAAQFYERSQVDHEADKCTIRVLAADYSAAMKVGTQWVLEGVEVDYLEPDDAAAPDGEWWVAGHVPRPKAWGPVPERVR